jgi:hypothetical protein
MVVIDSLPGAWVKVKVEGYFTTEFECQDDEVQSLDRHVITYIESQAGQHFSVFIHLNELFATNEDALRPWAAHVYVDGALTNRRTFPVGNFTGPGGLFEEIHAAEEVEDGYQIRREFRFAKANIGKLFGQTNVSYF